MYVPSRIVLPLWGLASAALLFGLATRPSIVRADWTDPFRLDLDTFSRTIAEFASTRITLERMAGRPGSALSGTNDRIARLIDLDRVTLGIADRFARNDVENPLEADALVGPIRRILDLASQAEQGAASFLTGRPYTGPSEPEFDAALHTLAVALGGKEATPDPDQTLRLAFLDHLWRSLVTPPTIRPIASNDGEAVARDLVTRLQERNSQRSRPEGSVSFDMMNHSRMVWEFDGARMDLIARYGVLAAIECYHGKLNNGLDRFFDPALMLGYVDLDFSQEVHRKLYPKCTYVVLTTEEGLQLPASADYPLSYGGSYAVLTREVQERSTWTYGDSKSRWRPGMPIQTFHEEHILSDGGARVAGSDDGRSGTILEGQVHGPLTLADVEALVVPGHQFGHYETNGSSGQYEPREESDLDIEQRRFLEIAQLFRIPVYMGTILTRARAYSDAIRCEIPGLEGLPIEAPLVKLSPGIPARERDPVDTRELESVLPPVSRSEFSAFIGVDRGVYTPGRSLGGHAVEYLKFCKECQIRMLQDRE